MHAMLGLKPSSTEVVASVASNGSYSPCIILVSYSYTSIAI